MASSASARCRARAAAFELEGAASAEREGGVAPGRPKSAMRASARQRAKMSAKRLSDREERRLCACGCVKVRAWGFQNSSVRVCGAGVNEERGREREQAYILGRAWMTPAGSMERRTSSIEARQAATVAPPRFSAWPDPEGGGTPVP